MFELLKKLYYWGRFILYALALIALLRIQLDPTKRDQHREQTTNDIRPAAVLANP